MKLLLGVGRDRNHVQLRNYKRVGCDVVQYCGKENIR